MSTTKIGDTVADGVATITRVDGLALERELQQRRFESDDAREGIAANLEKRKPGFHGR